MEAAGSMNSKPDADRAAHGEPAEMNTVKVERIQQTQDVATQLLDGVVARRYRRPAMSARVVTQNAEMPLQFFHLWIPHGKFGAERIGEHEHRLLITRECIVRPQFSDLDKRHCCPFWRRDSLKLLNLLSRRPRSVLAAGVDDSID